MIDLGYEVGTGKRIKIPLNHMAILGQTQLSGKTTTMEALAIRAGVRAISFVTKPGEKNFRSQNVIPAFFSEAAAEEYWKHVVAMLEYRSEVRLGWRERGVVIKLCQDYKKESSRIGVDAKGKSKRERVSYRWKTPKNLREVLANLESYLPFARSAEEMICIQLREFLRPVLTEIERTEFSDKLNLVRGINVMDITELSDGLKALVIRSVIAWVHKHGRKIVVIVPEAWKFIPEGRSTPVKLALEGLIREGAGVENFVWMDSQDLRGVDKMLLRSVIVWLFGVQRQKNEVSNTLASIPDYPKPTATEIMQLGRGQFYVCYGNTLVRTYVQPAGMEEEHAKSIALGEEKPESWAGIVRELDQETTGPGSDDREGLSIGRSDENGNGVFPNAGADALQRTGNGSDELDREEAMWKEKYEALKAEFDLVVREHNALAERLRDLEGKPGDEIPVAKDWQVRTRGSASGTVFDLPGLDQQYTDTNLEHVYAYVKKRAATDGEVLAILAERPQITVKTQRPVITVEANGSLWGGICQLTAEGFFKTAQPAKIATDEAIRRGWCANKTPVMRIETHLEKLAKMGFLYRETDGYRIVEGVKINLEG